LNSIDRARGERFAAASQLLCFGHNAGRASLLFALSDEPSLRITSPSIVLPSLVVHCSPSIQNVHSHTRAQSAFEFAEACFDRKRTASWRTLQEELQMTIETCMADECECNTTASKGNARNE
jgi:hypothetical protein